MRWIFLCLIFFNLLYFGWEFYVVPAETRDGDRADYTAGRAADDGMPGERLVLLKEVLSTSSEAVPPPSINRQARGQQLNPVGDEGSLSSQQALTAPVAEKGAVEMDWAEGKSLQSESGAMELPSTLEPEEPVLTRVCARMGPYEDQAVAESLLLGLQERGVQPVLRQDDVVLDIDNWVIIPPLGSRTEALKMLRRLQSNKIDSYLITEGEFINGISLGLFKQAASAQGVLARMESAGYSAEIHQIERTETRFWVGLTGEFEPGSIDQMLTQLVDDSEKINFSETLCEMFASTP